MPRTILVVDDEPDMELLIRQKFRKLISAGEFSFHFAGNGEMALQTLSNNPDIELVMTDINMPVMNGLTFLEKMAEAGFRCKTIVVSAYTDIQNIRSAMNRGAFDFVTKPIDFQDLETTIQKTLKAIDESKDAIRAFSERDEALKEKEQARTSERFKQQFLANMSHEIRTPMNSVIGITNLLLRSQLDDQQSRYVSMIQAASEQLMAIINDILDISKIEAGKMQFEKISFHPAQVLTNVKNILQMKADEKGLDLKMDIAADVPDSLTGDPSRLAQVLTNLVGNAIKFTDKGFVVMQCRMKKAGTPDCEVEFSVTDTGIGIAPEKLNSIFESFTQANSDTSRKYGGTGLGLTISKQLIELQGGRIGLESKPGMGTRFYFHLPFGTGSVVKQNEETVDNNDYLAQLTGIRILLVEDNDFNKIVAEDTLQEFLKDITIDHAENGKVALEKTAAGTYDVVLMDIQMPELDGYEATRTIRSVEGTFRHTAIMAMTANATPEEINKCFESGVDDYISKPFIPEELFRKMAQLIQKTRT
jgi:hypothetical protein